MNKEKYLSNRCPSSDTISSPKSDIPGTEPFISKETVEHASNCEFLLKIYHFPGQEWYFSIYLPFKICNMAENVLATPVQRNFRK